jgi:hypothetical protein
MSELGTYHGASTMMRKTLELTLHGGPVASTFSPGTQTRGYVTVVKCIVLRTLSVYLWTYCKGTVGKIFLIAVARASTIASTS